MDRIWLQNPLAVFTANDLDASGGVVVEGTTITELVPGGGTPTEPVDRSFDASRHVVLPGLINTHHHFYQTLTRAWAPVVNNVVVIVALIALPRIVDQTPRDIVLADRNTTLRLLLAVSTTAGIVVTANLALTRESAPPARSAYAYGQLRMNTAEPF